MSEHDYNLDLLRLNEKFYSAVGFAISNFAKIEFGLLCVFEGVCGLSRDKSDAAFWAYGSTRNQVSAINSILGASNLSVVHVDDWTALKKLTEKQIVNRDSLAHGEVVAMGRPDGRLDYYFGPRFLKNLAKGTGTTSNDWTPHEAKSYDDLLTFARDFYLLGAQLESFARRIRASGYAQM